MTEVEFKSLAAQGYNRIPLVLEAFADFDTALSVYLKLADEPYTYLLESVISGERFGRYSFVGLAAQVRLRVYGTSIEVDNKHGGVTRYDEADPLSFIDSFQKRYRASPHPHLPRFCGGLVGYFGYDTVRYIERKLAATAKPDVLGVPDIFLLLSEELAVLDNFSGKLHLVVYADPEEPNAYFHGMRRLRELQRQLRKAVSVPRQTASQVTQAQSEFGQSAFEESVARVREYIAEGDLMQVVLSQRLSMPFRNSPLALYRALRTLNPSPYMFFYHFGDFHIIGASAEI